MSQGLSDNDVATRLKAAIAIAEEAGALARRLRKDAPRKALGITSKGHQDFVTEADRSVEALIHDGLQEKFPGDGFLGEEGGRKATGGPIWVVDPIDGTSNFIMGLHHWAVSIALVDGNRVVAGVVHDGPRASTYSARVGTGAFCGDRRLSVRDGFRPADAMIIVGTSDRTSFEDYLSLLRNLHSKGAEHRRLGSAALGLVRVAEGVADAYFEASLNCWDALAGLLIAEEAGAVSRNLKVSAFLSAPSPVTCGSQAALDMLEGCIPAADTSPLAAQPTARLEV